MANPGEILCHDSNIVFIETNLETRFLILAHKDDTVSDFKVKLCNEHKLIFPGSGDIHVTALKVKRGQQFYHMHDSMNLFLVFKGITRDWFIFVDANKVENGNDSLPLAENLSLEEGLKTKKRKSIKTLDEKKTRKKQHSVSTDLSEVVAAATNTSTYVVDESRRREICAKVHVESCDVKNLHNNHNGDINQEKKHVDDLIRVAIKQDSENQEKDIETAVELVGGLITSGDVNDSHEEEYGQVKVGIDIGSDPLSVEKKSRKRKKSSKDTSKTSRKKTQEGESDSLIRNHRRLDNEGIALDSVPTT